MKKKKDIWLRKKWSLKEKLKMIKFKLEVGYDINNNKTDLRFILYS